MERRNFLLGVMSVAAAAGSRGGKVWAQAMGTLPDPEPVGTRAVEAVFQGGNGNVYAMDSLLYIYNEQIRPNDVVITGSYCGAANMPHVIKQGVRGMISHDAGIGLDQAGIGALRVGDEHGVPIAAVDGMSASISNGRSMAQGRISFANDRARALGVTIGMTATEAGKFMLAAPLRQKSDVELPFDKRVFERGRIGNCRMVASSALTNLNPDEDNSNCVIAWGAHSGAVVTELLGKWKVRGWIGNDAGMGKNNTGIGGLPASNALGIPAAAVSTMSARIGDGVSTFDEGVISAVNHLARSKGLREGMKASDAMKLLAG